MDMTPADLTTLLKQHVLEITFTKVNGETRVMPCTLRADRLPLKPITEDGKTVRARTPNLVSVFCTDKNEWRSFKFENLKSWKIVE